MAIQGLVETTPKQEQAKKEIRAYDLKVIILAVIFAIACVFLALVFAHKRAFIDTNYPIDYNAWGTYGDFVGGVLGTAIAGYALILMIRTLQKQIDSNLTVEISNQQILIESRAQRAEMIKQTEVTKRQLFDSQFNVFLRQYQAALNAYESPSGKSKGIKRVEEIVRNFRLRPFEYKTTYMKRCKSAVSRYEALYVRNRHYMSVHLRTLYQVFKFISTADIDEETRLLYAKVVRGQLSEAEMFLVRYNCYCYYGRKMQVYANQYNLLKHVSLMGLLEFKKYAVILNNNEMDNAIDAFYLNLRKNMVKAALNELPVDKSFVLECGERWKFDVEFDSENKEIDFTVINTPRNQPGGVPKLPLEKAFDQLGFDNVSLLMNDILKEMLFAKNFQLYNKSSNSNVRRKRKEQVGNLTKAGFVVKSTYPIVLTQRQLLNPVISSNQGS